jgi:transglutaminase-like putative cysteine protease
MSADIPRDIIKPLQPVLDMSPYLEPTETIDSDNPEILAFAREHGQGPGGLSGTAVRLYYAVRDGLRYDPYTLDLRVDSLKASNTLASGRGWCVSKAIVLTACCRALGIPARLGFADVRNHLSTERMRQIMKTDIFAWHGYTSIHLGGKWVKATPAFNVELCEKFRLGTLEFNGREDSLYHPFDLDGKQHMEYLRDHGEFADIPLDIIIEDFAKHYPGVDYTSGQPDFDREVEAEILKFELPETGKT